MKNPISTAEKKARRSQAARLFLYVSAGFVAGILFFGGSDYVMRADRAPRALAPVPTARSLSRAIPREEQNDRLNLNTATLEDLMGLPGIGPVLAQAILDYREEHQGFLMVEELMDVGGIGQKRFDAVKDFIFCAPP